MREYQELQMIAAVHLSVALTSLHHRFAPASASAAVVARTVAAFRSKKVRIRVSARAAAALLQSFRHISSVAIAVLLGNLPVELLQKAIVRGNLPLELHHKAIVRGLPLTDLS